MISKAKKEKILVLLKRDYPKVTTPLYHQTAFQLVSATLLSAQTLDATTNKFTSRLFKEYPTAKAMALANPQDIAEIIKGINYYKTKSRNLVKMANVLLNTFGGKVPNSIKNLITLPGVGRKTANVVIAEWFAKDPNDRGNWPKELGEMINDSSKDDPKIMPEGFVVDTHVIRTANRLGLTKHKDPVKIEQDLMKIFPRDEWNDASLRLIFHGRLRCKAQNPKCNLDPEWSLLCDCVKLKK